MDNINKLNDKELEKVAGGTLSQDEALAKALEHAQLSKDQLDFIKNAEMDFERGCKVWEIKFYHGGFEYEYKINAENGKILGFERDFD